MFADLSLIENTS